MKKGDLRKQEIIQTAEMLFCQKGYEQTSIQDILDQLKISKGSFYHHFVSKEALLETICLKRAEQNLENTLTHIEEKKNSSQKLNNLLSSMIPFHNEKLSFILMLLPIFILPEGESLKFSYCESLKSVFHPSVRDAIDEGVFFGEMLCSDSELFADIVINLNNRLWISICDTIIENEANQKANDLSELLHVTDQYRTAIERILSIPYGNIVIIDIPMLKGLMDQIHIHWNKNHTNN